MKKPCMYCRTCDIYNNNLSIIEFDGDFPGREEEFQASVISDPDLECNAILVQTDFLDLKIKINYCPMCGRKI